MKNKAVLHEFSLAIYPRRLWIAISSNEFKDMLDGADRMDESCNGCVDNVYYRERKLGGILIRFASKKEMTVANITHESTHAAMEICAYIGSKIDLKNQEYFSYLCGYIAKCCDEVKNNKTKK